MPPSAAERQCRNKSKKQKLDYKLFKCTNNLATGVIHKCLKANRIIMSNRGEDVAERRRRTACVNKIRNTMSKLDVLISSLSSQTKSSTRSSVSAKSVTVLNR